MQPASVSKPVQSAAGSSSGDWRNFPITAFAGMSAQLIVQPVIMVKVRIQLRSESGLSVSPGSVIREVYGERGLTGFYRGGGAGVLRQLVYSPVRMGAFYLLSDYLKARSNTSRISTPQKVFSAATTGALGAIFATPFDVAMVRLQADATLPPDRRRHYTGVFNALRRIPVEDGLLTYFRGVIPNMARCGQLNAIMMSSFQELKERIIPILGDNTYSMLLASILSGVLTAVCSLPFDNMKTKLQKMKEGPNGQFPYKGLLDCFGKTIRRQGIRGLWSGLPVYFTSVTPHAFTALMLTEYLRRFFL